MSRALAIAALCSAAAPGCNILIDPDGLGRGGFEIPPDGVTCAHLEQHELPTARLWVQVRMARTTIGLAPVIAGLVEGVRRSIAKSGAVVDQVQVAPLVAEPTIPRVMFTDACQSPATTPLADVLQRYAETMGDANTTACEHTLLAELGLPPGRDDDRVSNPARDAAMLVVLYIDAGARNHPLSACTVNGQEVPDYFGGETDGHLAWWSPDGATLAPEQVLHLVVATAEGDVSLAQLTEACLAQPEFPAPLVDFLSPSPALYYTPFVAAMKERIPKRAAQLDLCRALSPKGPAALAKALEGVLP